MAGAIIVRPFPIVAALATNSAAGHDPLFVANDFLGVTWKSLSGSFHEIIVDLGADTAFDTVALFGLTGAAADWVWTVSAATAAQGTSFPVGSWVGGGEFLLAGSAMPVSGRGKALWIAPTVSPPPPSRYIRIGISGSLAKVIGRVVIGQRMVLQRNFAFGAAFGVRELGRVDFSRRGVMLRARGAKQRSVGITFPHVHRDEVEAVVHPLLERIGGTEPVLLVTDPDANAQRQNRMFFGPLIGDIGTIWARPGGFEWRANLTALDI